MQQSTLGQRAFRLTTLVAFIIPVFGTATNAFACAACGCTLSTNWQTQGINTTPGMSLNLTYSYINQNQQRYGTDAASTAKINQLLAAGQEVEDYTRTQTVTAMFNYTAGNWGATVQLPYINRKHATYADTAPLGSSYLTSSANGIGDIRMLGRYTGLSTDRSKGFIVGLKLPTGNTSTTFNDGSALDPSLQIGTGSTDVILGGFMAGNIENYGWFVQGSFQHAVKTKSFEGEEYKPGDTYSFNTGIRRAKFGAKFTPMLQLNIIHRRADEGGAASPSDVLTSGPATGGTLAYLAPGATLRIGSGTSVYGFVQLPVYQKVNSLQLAPKYTVTLGVRLSL